MREMEETQRNVTQVLEQIPTQAYIGLAVGSILASAFFYLTGRRTTALFVGQWPPTFAAFALIYKLLHPSGERPIEQMRHAGEQVRETAREMGSRTSR
ncbi:MAG: hypothetical protein ACYC5J_00515 [Chloroflexota bacterium]